MGAGEVRLAVVDDRTPRRGGRVGASEMQRRRLLDAMTALARERGWHGLSVDRICAQAGMSRRTFYEQFTDAEDCFAATVEDALEQLWLVVAAEIEAAGEGWAERVCAAVTGFLAALDADPGRAWMCVVEPLNTSTRGREARKAFVDRFITLLQAGPTGEPGDRIPANAAVGAAGGLWELALQHVAGEDDGVGIDDIAGSAIFLALAPYVGRHEAMQHAYLARKPADVVLIRGGTAPSPAEARTIALADALTPLSLATLRFLADHPGAPNLDIAAAVAVTDEGQMSRHLRRLRTDGLADREKHGIYNAWSLTDLGQTVLERLG
jgi:AcrR family transcriptional regulator